MKRVLEKSIKKPVFTGSGVAICTPFAPGGEIDYQAFERLIEFQISNGTRAIIILGTTGENPTVNDGEFKDVVKFAVSRINGRVPIVVGTGKNDTAHSVKLSQTAEKLGANALLLATPYYNKTTQAGLIAHIKTVAAATSLPIILYNVPSRTGMSFTPETYAELARLPTVNGVKEAGGDFTLLLRTLHKCPDDFYIYAGNDDQITAMMALGAVGVISVLANIEPKRTQELCRLALENDFAAAAALQIELCDLIDALFLETNPIPAKAALEAMSLCGGRLRLPLIPMGEKNKAALLSTMRKHGLIT